MRLVKKRVKRLNGSLFGSLTYRFDPMDTVRETAPWSPQSYGRRLVKARGEKMALDGSEQSGVKRCSFLGHGRG